MDNEAGKHEPTVDDDNESLPISAQNEHLQSIPLLNGSRQFHPMDLDSNEHVIMDTENIPPDESEYLENVNRGDIAVSQGDPLSSTSDVWPVVSMSDSYYHSTSINHDYASASEMSLGHSRVFGEQPARLIDLESGNHEDTLKDLLHRQPNDRSFFNPYPEQEVNRNELLQQLFKPQEGFPYHHERKQAGLGFQPASNVSMETGQFSGHLAQQIHPSLPLELRQKGLNDLYVHQNIREKMFSDGGRYTLPRQEQFSSVNVQDWAANTAHMSMPLQSHLGGGELGRNWFSGNQVRGGWSSLDGAVGLTQSMGNRGNTDQSLFGVLSQCNQLNPGGPYDSVNSTERLIQPGSYGGVGALVPTSNNMLLQAAHPLDFLSGGHETAAPGKSNTKGWTSIPHQNSALQDSMGKSFLRSWNKQG